MGVGSPFGAVFRICNRAELGLLAAGAGAVVVVDSFLQEAKRAMEAMARQVVVYFIMDGVDG
jgi:hypothetical protein